MIELIVIQGFTFLALILLLKKLLHANFAKAMKRMEMINQETEKRRAELQARLAQAQHEQAAGLKRIEEEAARSREEAEQEAAQIKANALAEAQIERDRLLEDARAKGEEIRHALLAETAERAVRYAADALRYVFSTELGQGVHQRLIEDLIADLEKIDGKRLNGVSQEAAITVPFDLTEEQKRRLTQILEGKTKRRIQVASQVDRSLLAGMVLRFENVILDGSLKAKLKEAVGYVKKAEKTAGA